jgi:hypothetical protein
MRKSALRAAHFPAYPLCPLPLGPPHGCSLYFTACCMHRARQEGIFTIKDLQIDPADIELRGPNIMRMFRKGSFQGINIQAPPEADSLPKF